MLDLRIKGSAQGDPGPSAVNTSGVPPVGVRVSTEPTVLRQSPILDHASRGVLSVEAPPNDDRNAFFIAVAMVILGVVSGLTAQYLAIQANQQSAAQSDRFNTLQNQLLTGDAAMQLSKLRVAAAQLDGFDTMTSQLAPWPDVVDIFAKSTPGAIQLVNVHFDTEAGTATLDGRANAYTDVSYLMQSLENTQQFQSPELSAATNASDQQGGVTFSIRTTFSVDNALATATGGTNVAQ